LHTHTHTCTICDKSVFPPADVAHVVSANTHKEKEVNGAPSHKGETSSDLQATKQADVTASSSDALQPSTGTSNKGRSATDEESTPTTDTPCSTPGSRKLASHETTKLQGTGQAQQQSTDQVLSPGLLELGWNSGKGSPLGQEPLSPPVARGTREDAEISMSDDSGEEEEEQGRAGISSGGGGCVYFSVSCVCVRVWRSMMQGVVSQCFAIHSRNTGCARRWRDAFSAVQGV